MRRRTLWIVLAVVAVVLVAIRLALPSIIERVVESKLETMPGGYQGTVEGVAVRMLSAEIGLLGFQIRKKNGQIPVPFMTVREFVLDTELESWRPRTVLRVLGPEGNFVDAESEAKKQTGPDVKLEEVRQQLPFELLRVEVEDGTFHFRKYQTRPDLDMFVQGLDLTWDKLVGCMPPGNASCRSTIEGSGKLMKSGLMKVRGRFARKPEVDVHVTAHVRDLRAPELNPALAEFAKVRMEHGTVELDLRYDRAGERHDALLIPLLSDVEVEEAEGEDKSFLREVGVGAAAGWFERKKGKKGIAITRKPSGKSAFEIVDKPTVAEHPAAQD